MEALEILFAFLKAFAVGGLICAIAQVVINFTDLTAGKILVIFMLAGIVLTAFGLYQPIVEWAGAGATVPISGFGYLLASGAMKGAQEGLFQALTGALAAASAGVSAAVVFSFLASLIFRSRKGLTSLRGRAIIIAGNMGVANRRLASLIRGKWKFPTRR